MDTSCLTKFVFLWVFALTTSGSFAAEPNRPEKPNVLFLISDDLNTALSGFGHPQCKTPNLDRLAERGVKFENMHCQYPVCGSSRASIMSGLYPYTNLTLANTGTLRGSMPDVVTLSQAFRSQGYYAGRVSKIYHMRIPFEIIDGTAESDDPLSWDEAFNVKALEQNAPGEKTNWSPKDKGSQSFTGVMATGGDQEHADGMAADKAIEILEKVKDKPFFLAVGFVRPHVPLVAPKKYFDRYDRASMIRPSVPGTDLDDVPGIIRGYKANETTYGVTPELHKGLLQAYYASVSYMDAQVGRVLDALKEKGLADNTIVVFSSDHGYLLGHHHKFQKQHLFEESTRVPFIVSVPWMKDQHGNGTKKITELVDMYPTLTELAGIPAPQDLHGTSLKPLLQDTASSAWTKDQAFTISRSGGESIRTKDWRFTQWGFGERGTELYDLKNDPGEFTNQAKNPKYAATVKKLQEQLITKRNQAGFEKNKIAILKKVKLPKQKKTKSKSAGKAVSLFNGKDLTGWHVDVPHRDENPDAKDSFIVRDGMLVSLGTPNGHLITDAIYENYRLQVEYRFAGKPGNCGVLVHASTPRALYKMFPKSIEVQMNHKHAGDFWCIVQDIKVPNMLQRRGPKEKWGVTEGMGRRILNLTDDSEKPVGQWNKMDIECVGDAVKVWVNGDLVNHGTGCTATKGQLALQAEGSEVEFRKLKLTPIAKLTE